MTNTLTLTVTASDGTVLDSIAVEREDWDAVQTSAMDALALLSDLSVGPAIDS